MAKSKEEEEEEKQKSDGLEIISIGSLYSGTWDKKYWSSSRGKDRFPYPVGYRACRAYNGSTCKMEIQEGPRGPLFLITSADGHSCSGQTPDIAWEKFQKKGFLHMKIWHGKRFSCKIDGIELFGFRNPLVQRLLRELAANVNGLLDHSLLSSSFHNRASNVDQNNQYQDTSTSSDLSSYLARLPVTGKRSRRHETVNHKSPGNDSFKRLCVGDPTHSPKQSCFLPSSKFHETHGPCILPQAVPAVPQLNSASGKENVHSFANDFPHLRSVNYFDHCREKAVSAQDEKKPASFENYISTTVVSNSCAEEKPLDTLQDAEVNESTFPVSSELKVVDTSCPEESQGVHDADLCVPDTDLGRLIFSASLEFKAVDDPCPEESQNVYAPDTLDVMQDNTANFATTTWDKNADNDAVVSKQLVNRSNLEEEPGTFNPNVSSEKSDFGSVGEDIAKSMMTLLLPQAIPLLKKTSRKKKKIISSSENFSFASKPHEEDKETGSFMKVESSDVDQKVVQGSEHIISVVFDKLDGDQCQDHLMNKLELPPDHAEAEELSFGKGASCANGGELFVDVDGKESLEIHANTGGNNILDDDDGQLNANKRPQDGNLYLSESIQGCMPASKKVPTKVNQDVCQNMDEKSLLSFEINSKGKNLEPVPDCNEVVGTNAARVLEALGHSVQLSNDSLNEAGASQHSNISSYRNPKIVYTRKKVPCKEPTGRKHNYPHLESVKCRKLLNGCVPETTGTPELETYGKKEVSYADTSIGGQLNSLHIDKTVETSNPELESQGPSIPAGRICQDMSNLSVPSLLHAEKTQVQYEERLVELKNSVDVNGLGSQEGIEFCHSNTTTAKEDKSEVKIQRNLEFNNELEGIVEFLGCYIHPMPILSLMLSRKGNEVYICALCGHLVDEIRNLFLYKLGIEGPSIGCPSFIGHTSVTWPSSTDIFGREIAFERSGLQFTPDGQCLVLLGSTRTPYCREGRLDCLCAACTSDCFDKGVKIVQVKTGYVSVLVNLGPTDCLQCVLVCEPDHLVAAGENRRLHLWTMNSRWSAPTEEFTIQSNDYISPSIMELKRIPNCASLVIGHNGFGEFTLWDISRRIYVSKFSSPCNEVQQFCPISLFCWQREVHGFSYSNVKAQVDNLMDATKMWLSEQSLNHSLPPLEKDYFAIWFLVSTASDSDAQHDYGSSDHQIKPVGCWRLALLVKNTLIFGSALDPRAAAIGTSAGHGIVGTRDGLVYMWEHLTGKSLGTLHEFKGGSVSCIATGDSGSGVLAVADDRGQLLVYLCPQ